MPVVGTPDPERHRFCFRCHRWFEPDEGIIVDPERQGMSGDMFMAFHGMRRLAEGETKPRFKCHHCVRIERTRTLIIWGLFGLALLAAAFAAWFGRS